jgi:hypothetical protein
MAKQIILAVNQTGSPITLAEFGEIVIPASSSVNLSDSISVHELQKSQELYNHVNNGDVLLNVGATLLTQAESLTALEGLMLISSTTTSQFELRDAVSHKDLTNNPHALDLSALNAPSTIFFPYTQETSSGTISQFLTTTQKTSDGWKTITLFPYDGTDQFTPSSVIVRARWGGQSGTYGLRVIDVTNGSAVVASVTGLSNETAIDQNLGTLSNLPTGGAEMELQVEVINTQDRDVELTFLLVNF